MENGRVVVNTTFCPFPCTLLFFIFVALRQKSITGLHFRFNMANEGCNDVIPAQALMSSANNVKDTQ